MATENLLLDTFFTFSRKFGGETFETKIAIQSIYNNDEDDLADFSRPSNVVKWKINAAQYFHCIILAYISFAFTFILPTFICRDKYFRLVFIFLYINEIIFYVFITFLYISICLFILSMFIILSDCICITETNWWQEKVSILWSKLKLMLTCCMMWVCSMNNAV